MTIIYRISHESAGYKKDKLRGVNNRNCLLNALRNFSPNKHRWVIIADNMSKTDVALYLKSYFYVPDVKEVSIGHGAGTFNLALDYALELDKDEIVYFLENDYIHRDGSDDVIVEGLERLGANFVSLYDHPDKYLDPKLGGNPYCSGGAEDTRVYRSSSCWWKMTNSTTMTFASKVATLKKFEETFRKHTTGSYPEDFKMFIDLRNQGATLLTSIPGYSTHGEKRWLSPGIDWEKMLK
jgi:hypothetical protein